MFCIFCFFCVPILPFRIRIHNTWTAQLNPDHIYSTLKKLWWYPQAEEEIEGHEDMEEEEEEGEEGEEEETSPETVFLNF